MSTLGFEILRHFESEEACRSLKNGAVKKRVAADIHQFENRTLLEIRILGLEVSCDSCIIEIDGTVKRGASQKHWPVNPQIVELSLFGVLLRLVCPLKLSLEEINILSVEAICNGCISKVGRTVKPAPCKR